MKKRFCVLQITPEYPNPEHEKLFLNEEESDFYFVTYKAYNKNSLKFCPNTLWSETRNILAELVPKSYDYYAFIDHDMGLESRSALNPYEQILEDLNTLNPAVLTYYPGRGLDTPYAKDKKYLESKDYSCMPFTHNGIKIVHESLLKWFFPLCTKFSVDIDACHMFNIKEIPFLKHVVCSHKMVHHNNPTDSASEQIYNKNGAFAKLKMDEMWNWIRPAFKQTKLIDSYASSETQKRDSLTIKNSLVGMFKNKQVDPIPSPKGINYFNKKRIEKFFDLNHEHFKNIDLSVEEQCSYINNIKNKI